MNDRSNTTSQPNASPAGPAQNRATERRSLSKDRKGINQIAAPLAPLESPKLISLSSVPVEEVRWLLPDLIPLGSITVLDGDKGEGKSPLMYDFAARLTSGTPMPFSNGHSITGGAILLQAEDDLGAVKMSIEAAGGNPGRICVFNKKDSLYLDNPDDVQLIRQAATKIGAKLLVVDPFSEFFSKTLKDEKVIRESFRLLMALAHDFQLAVNLIRHPTKCGNNPLHRGLGGVAVINVARAALVVGRNPSSEDPFQHVLAFNRGNLPRTRDRSLIYRTVRRGDAIVIEWLGESSYSANDIVAAAHNADTQSQLQEACYVLYSALAAHEGPMAATQVDAAAQAALVSVGTLKRAKNVLKVRSRRELDRTPTMAGGPTKARWLWELPADEDLLRPYRERFEREQQEETTPEITDDHDAKTKDRGTGKNGTAVNSPEKKDNGGASTPQWLFDRCNQLAIQACGEPITLDVAAAEWNHKCDRYFTEADDGLKQEWDAKAVWCNPPFLATTVESFVRKALEAAQHGTTTLLLIPWWNYPYLDLCERHGRIHRICSPVSFQRQDCTTLTMNNGFRSTSLVVVVFGPTVRPGCGTPIRKGDTFADNIDTKVGSAGDQPVTEVQDTPAKSMPAAPAVRPPQDPPLPEMVTNG